MELFVFALWVLGVFFGGPIIMTCAFFTAGLIDRRRLDGHVVQGFVIIGGWAASVVWFAVALTMAIVSGIAWAGTL